MSVHRRHIFRQASRRWVHLYGLLAHYADAESAAQYHEYQWGRALEAMSAEPDNERAYTTARRAAATHRRWCSYWNDRAVAIYAEMEVMEPGWVASWRRR